MTQAQPAPAVGGELARDIRNVHLVVAIGISSGALDACRKLFSALPAPSALTFILLQHDAADSDSHLIRLVGSMAGYAVRAAADGAPLAPDTLYIIPPETHFQIVDNALRKMKPPSSQGDLPFDCMLKSLAASHEDKAVCVMLSGNGFDGNIGLKAIKERGGLILAQQAADDAPPHHAMAAGHFDLDLSVDAMPDAITRYGRSLQHAQSGVLTESHQGVGEIIRFLGDRIRHDFSLYKPAMAQRRILRRMAMASLDPHEFDRYLDFLRANSQELDQLARDLLMNVTAFFRDAEVFAYLADTIVPDLIARHSAAQPLRVWVAGCSSGEEVYSLIMLLREEMSRQGRDIKLQVFASDIDSEAILVAREGFYPVAIEADVSQKRLQQFFSREDFGYRVRPELRSPIVFSVSDLLTDPPFSRLDFISCRNLLVHLLPEAQERVVAQFDFALRKDGILLLGPGEALGGADERFHPLSAGHRVYRHVGRRRHSRDHAQALTFTKTPASRLAISTRSRNMQLAEHSCRLLTDTVSAATILINQRDECLYFLGNIEKYLWMAPGQPSLDILALAQRSVRPKLRFALQRARIEQRRFILKNARMRHGDDDTRFSIEVRPTQVDGEAMWFVCLREQAAELVTPDMPSTAYHESSRVAALEEELESTRSELEATIHSLETATEEQKASYEEVISVNEEFQSINNELLTSKEELQSLNEELMALNGQLQEALDRQEMTSTDLQNVLYSAEEAILVLDSNFNIRFFTPATKSLFNLLPSDVGRPLGDLNPLTTDTDLLSAAGDVLATGSPKEREVCGKDGQWFVCRIRPYRTFEGSVQGIVIIFTDITELKNTAAALSEAKQRAEHANLAKSRFLASASHDLRQPLQTLALLQGLLARMTQGAPEQKLVTLLDQTLVALSGMLNTVLDINQIDAGIVEVKQSRFSAGVLLERLRDEFAYHAQSKGIDLRVVPSSIEIVSDAVLLEQMIRGLLANALKFTEKGKVLLGCRRRGAKLQIEIWDTGIGIPDSDIHAIFRENHPVAQAAGGKRKGMGFGLSIVQRLGSLLRHRVDVHSEYGKGSVFSIEIDRIHALPVEREARKAEPEAAKKPQRATILVIEDDREIRDLLTLFLLGESHQVAATGDGAAALDLVRYGSFRPDIIITDFKLPNGPDGVEVVKALRSKFLCDIPAIFLTGDLMIDPLRDLALPRCQQLQKPVKARDLSETIARLQMPSTPPLEFGEQRRTASSPVIFVVDDDATFRRMLREALEPHGYLVEDFRTAEDFLASYLPGGESCLLIDAYLPGMSGLDLLDKIKTAGLHLPAIMITGIGDTSTAVQAMNAGALEFFEKPADLPAILASIQRAITQSRALEQLTARKSAVAGIFAKLTSRQTQILEMILSGMPNKVIAAELAISQRTVENHRAEIMKKTGATSLPDLARLAIAASGDEDKAFSAGSIS